MRLREREKSSVGGWGGGVRCPEATLELEEGWETERDPLRRVRLRLLCAPVSTAGRAEEVPPPPPRTLGATHSSSLPPSQRSGAIACKVGQSVSVRPPDALLSSSLPCSPPCSPLSFFFLIRGHPSLQRPFIICHFWGQLGAG